MANTPIADYALLSDRRTAALSAARDRSFGCASRASIPRPSSQVCSTTGRALAVHPTGPAAVATRRYLDETMVLETTLVTATGTIVLVDALATGPTNDPHALGAAAPRLLVRMLECTAGEVEIAVEFAPRPEYGLVGPLLLAVDGGVVARGGADVVVLSAAIPIEVGGSTARGAAVMRTGQRLTLGVHHRTTSEPYPAPLPAHDLDDALRVTIEAWRAWSRTHQALPGPVARPRVRRRAGAAGLVLPAHRRRRGRGDDVASGVGGRRAQLGLPLHLGARLQLHVRGTVGRRLP